MRQLSLEAVFRYTGGSPVSPLKTWGSLRFREGRLHRERGYSHRPAAARGLPIRPVCPATNLRVPDLSDRSCSSGSEHSGAPRFDSPAPPGGLSLRAPASPTSKTLPIPRRFSISKGGSGATLGLPVSPLCSGATGAQASVGTATVRADHRGDIRTRHGGDGADVPGRDRDGV